MKTYVVTPHYNRHNETVLMMGHKICFYGEIWPIISKLTLLPPLICSTAYLRRVMALQALQPFIIQESK